MRLFFFLAPDDGARANACKGSATNFAKQLGFAATFSDDRPADATPVGWLEERLANADVAFFDVTTLNPDVLIAYGIGQQSDAQCVAMCDVDHAQRARAASLLGPLQAYAGPGDFGWKARRAIEQVQGAAAVRNKELVERIKRKVEKLGPIPLRDIAHEIGHRPDEIRFIVYDLVQRAELKKENYGRWSKYRV